MSGLRRKSGPVTGIFAMGVLLIIAMLLHANVRAESMKPEVELRSELVAALGLSDLCLFTEARYTRHPSTADMHTAFQDHPFSLEHFPSGSFISPPSHIGTTYPASIIKDDLNGNL